MSKYSKEFKLEVIEYYEKNYIGFSKLAEHFKIQNKYVVSGCIKNYQEHGINGLIRNNIKFKFYLFILLYFHKT